LTIKPFADTHDDIKFLIIEALDITDLIKTRKEFQKLNKELEERVKSRTKQLEESYDKLEQTQKRMIAQEKMASIGHLAAGVAHEINNPLCFIEHNVTALNEYTKTFFSIIDQYENFISNCHCKKLNTDTPTPTDVINENDYDDYKFIKTDFEDLFVETTDGIKNVTNIVKDLRSFARQDNEKTEDVWLNSCVKTSLNVMKNEINEKVTVKTYLNSDKLIKASNDKITQVFINMISNAVHAMPDGGELILETYDKENYACVFIKDTGWGIKEEDMQKLFDPFFTTKEVGKGTGLGLSISIGIIEKYGGEIKVSSELNKGTEFEIRLPYNVEKNT
jgi:C4-dicarboxylate-specific signal transduction histidine kinase